MHLLHQGRKRYLLIRAAAPWGPYDPSSGKPPEIREVVMGTDMAKGEVRQLLVESGWWKVSMLLEEDLNNTAADKNKVGALISEVVCPGECAAASPSNDSL